MYAKFWGGGDGEVGNLIAELDYANVFGHLESFLSLFLLLCPFYICVLLSLLLSVFINLPAFSMLLSHLVNRLSLAGGSIDQSSDITELFFGVDPRHLSFFMPASLCDAEDAAPEAKINYHRELESVTLQHFYCIGRSIIVRSVLVVWV